MKKILTLALAGALALTLSACGSSKEKLYILNWGDYIKSDLVDEFEDTYNCKVISDDVESNETMYTNIKTNKGNYDIAVPSDYMIDKLYKDDLLIEFDYSKLTNYTTTMFRDKLQTLMDTEGAEYKNYFVPYFWGTLGIMYNTSNPEIEKAVLENGYKCLFDASVLPEGAKVGMYDCARDSFAAAQCYLGYSLNTTNDEELKACRDLLKKNSYEKWGTDDLKTSVASGNLDLALVYSGDYFDQRYQYIDNEMDINFKLYAPTAHNNVFYDGLVIPKTSQNTELAYKFIDFFLDKDNSFENTDYVGYAPVIEETYKIFEEEAKTDEYYKDLLEIAAYNPSNVVNGEVYKYLGKDYDATLENYFYEAKTK